MPTRTHSQPPGRLVRWGKRLLITALLLGAAGYAVTWLPGFGATPKGERLARIEQSPHWRDGAFFNAQPTWSDLRAAFKQLVFGTANPHDAPQQAVAVVHTPAASLQQAPASGLRVTWFGHSSTLVEVDGVRVLIDPFWGDYAGPIAGLGPKRWYAPPLALADLPPVDAVVISHDHYDHLDRASIEAMRDWRNVFVVPLGMGAHLERWGIAPARIREVDWWQSQQVGALTITSTPARHASGRLSNASNQTLWTGFALVGPQHRVWYSGDSGFHEDLAQIGERLGPFDVSLLDTGQYSEHWPDVHMGPELAVRAHQLVRAKQMIPVHWALLTLSPHTWTEPIERVRAEAACRNVALLVLRQRDLAVQGDQM